MSELPFPDVNAASPRELKEARQFTLDLMLGDALRDAAIRRVADNANPDWKVEAVRVVSTVAQRMPEFTTDDVWHLIEEVTHEPRAMGPVMKAAAAAGLIEATDRFKLTERPSRHRAPVRVWKSLVYKETDND